MKHLNKYSKFNLEKYSKLESVGEFDVNLAMSKIKGKYSDTDVAEMLDNEILEWVDPDWEDESESEYDWYMEHNNGEAEDVVIEHIINWYRKEYDKKLSGDDCIELFDEIKSHYGI